MFSNQQQPQSEYQNPWACGPRMSRCGGHPMKARWKAAMAQRFGEWAGPAANIEETDEAFVISLYAAGIRKEAVHIHVKNDVLEVSYKPDETNAPEMASREHSDNAWKRGFRLNGKVLTENISASYTDGVLSITLPKNPDTNTKPVTVSVS